MRDGDLLASPYDLRSHFSITWSMTSMPHYTRGTRRCQPSTGILGTDFHRDAFLATSMTAAATAGSTAFSGFSFSAFRAISSKLRYGLGGVFLAPNKAITIVPKTLAMTIVRVHAFPARLAMLRRELVHVRWRAVHEAGMDVTPHLIPSRNPSSALRAVFPMHGWSGAE